MTVEEAMAKLERIEDILTELDMLTGKASHSIPEVHEELDALISKYRGRYKALRNAEVCYEETTE